MVGSMILLLSAANARNRCPTCAARGGELAMPESFRMGTFLIRHLLVSCPRASSLAYPLRVGLRSSILSSLRAACEWLSAYCIGTVCAFGASGGSPGVPTLGIAGAAGDRNLRSRRS